MTDEAIIRREASRFYNIVLDIQKSRTAIECFRDLKVRLNDFYAPENKAIFLDEVQEKAKQEVKKYQDQSQQKASDNYLRIINKGENLLFYIRQEIGVLPTIARQHFQETPVQKRDKVFVSYSSKDQVYLEEIQRYFKPFLGEVDYWDASKIQPGQDWKVEIAKAISHTKVAILLISMDFLGSDFITTNELPPLIAAAEEEGAVLLSILLRPSYIEGIPALTKFQAMNPSDRPVSKMEDHEREELFVNLVRQTLRVLREE